MTQVINLLGGPSIGKSVYAAKLYAELSELGYSVALVQEYVKKWAWQGILPGKYDQPFITGQQIKAESMLYGKVDFIVTDASIYQGSIYEEHYFNQDTVSCMIDDFMELSSDIKRHYFMVERNDKFWTKDGRYGSLNKAKLIDEKIRIFFTDELIVCKTYKDLKQHVITLAE